MSERTESPTPWRRRVLRSKGIIAHGLDVAPSIGFLVLTVMMGTYGATVVAELVRFMRLALRVKVAERSWSVPEVHQAGLEVVLWALWLFVPWLLLVMGVGVAVNVLQTRFLLTLAPLRPDWGRLNPARAMARLLGPRQRAAWVYLLLKLILLGGVGYRWIRQALPQMALLAGLAVEDAARLWAQQGWGLAWRMAGVWVILAILEAFYQHWQFERDIRLTRHELLEELRQVEGDPAVKGRRRRAWRQFLTTPRF